MKILVVLLVMVAGIVQLGEAQRVVAGQQGSSNIKLVGTVTIPRMTDLEVEQAARNVGAHAPMACDDRITEFPGATRPRLGTDQGRIHPLAERRTT